MKWQNRVFTIMMLIIINIAIVNGCLVSYNIGQNLTIQDTIEPAGLGTDCNITIYSNNTLIAEETMIRTGLAYYYTNSSFPTGIYAASIICNQTGTLYLNQCNFEITGENTMYYEMIGTLTIWILAMVLAFIFIRKQSPFLAGLITTIISAPGLYIASYFNINQIFPMLLILCFVSYTLLHLAKAFRPTYGA